MPTESVKDTFETVAVIVVAVVSGSSTGSFRQDVASATQAISAKIFFIYVSVFDEKL
jgi:hypothetical protein